MIRGTVGAAIAGLVVLIAMLGSWYTVDQTVTLVQAERWNGVLPTTMVPGSVVPFVSLK
jgi:hypothetical protein